MYFLILLSGKNHEAFQKTTFPRTTDMFGIHMSLFWGEKCRIKLKMGNNNHI